MVGEFPGRGAGSVASRLHTVELFTGSPLSAELNRLRGFYKVPPYDRMTAMAEGLKRPAAR